MNTDITCPECHRRIASIATYTCTVPSCFKARFCSPYCMLKHMADHVKERDESIAELNARLDAVASRLVKSGDKDTVRGFVFNLNPAVRQEISVSLCGINHLISLGDARELVLQLTSAIDEVVSARSKLCDKDYFLD